MKGKQAREKLLTTVSNRENADQPLCIHQNVESEEWLTTPSAGEDTSLGGGDTQNGTTTWENGWQFPVMFNTHLPSEPAIPLVGIDPKERKTYVHTNTCT